MSNVYDILCVIDCDNPNGPNGVKMYAGDTRIVTSGEGGHELAVHVPTDSVLRWRAVPLQLNSDQGGTDEYYHTIISKVHLWGANPGNNQGDARPYLVEWAANRGEGGAPIYAHNSNVAPDHEIALDTVGRYRPYIQCNTTLEGRDQRTSPKVAYTFYVKIYRGEDFIREISWDPYVTVYRD